NSSGFLADRYAIETLARLVPPAPSAAVRSLPATASAITPVSTLTLPMSNAPSVRGLGVTQAVAGYDALPGMADELCYVVHGPIAGLTTPSSACPHAATG